MEGKMKNNNPQGSTDLFGTLSRAVRLLEYLQKHTDKDNTISQMDLLCAGGEDHIFGAKRTLKKNIVFLANLLNTDEHGNLNPKEERRLLYKGFDEFFDSDDEMPMGVTDIYYNHVFSEDELTAIINALYSSKAVSRAQAESISNKLAKNLATEEFGKYYREMYKLDFSEPSDSSPESDPELLSKNIAFIQKAITERVQISFEYYRIYSDPHGYGRQNSDGLKTYKSSRVKYVSPYYISCDHGRLFLLGAFDNGMPCVFRVDMMKDIIYAGKGSGKTPALKKTGEMLDVAEFKRRHLYGSYDDWTTVKFEWSCRDEKTGEFICTALYGAFGKKFEIDENGIVTVQASRFGMKIFALQYADYVKVISPDDLVDEIRRSVSGLAEKYFSNPNLGQRREPMDML